MKIQDYLRNCKLLYKLFDPLATVRNTGWEGLKQWGKSEDLPATTITVTCFGVKSTGTEIHRNFCGYIFSAAFSTLSVK